MDETKENQENESVSQDTAEAPKEDSNNGLSVIQSANAAAERAEKAAAALKAENDRKEQLMAEEKLAGTSGGKVEPEKPKEDTPEEYVQKVMNGEVGEKSE